MFVNPTNTNDGAEGQATGDTKKQRDNFRVEMRRDQRKDIINKRRFGGGIVEDQQTDDAMHPKIDLSHLDSVPNGEVMKAEISKFLEMPVTGNELMEFIGSLTSEDRLKRHWALIG